MLGPGLVRQYSVPIGTPLYRAARIRRAARCAVYDPVFPHIAASFTVTEERASDSHRTIRPRRGRSSLRARGITR